MAGFAAHNPSGGDARSHLGFSRVMHRGAPLALRVRYDRPDFGSSGAYISETFGRTPASLCVLQLHEFPSTDAWREGRHFCAPRLPKDSFFLLDLRETWQTEVPAPFDNIHLNIVQSCLDDAAAELACSSELGFESYSLFYDDTLRHLALSLLPALRRPAEVNALFTEHVALAVALHLLQRCGAKPDVGRRLRGGLAAWQERRARDYIRDHLDADIDLRLLASDCGLSPAHFAKAFKCSVGMPPHRWLLKQRVDRACELLAHGNDRLEAVALACGFADQSHMTRVFSRATGVPPGAWRRMRRS